MYFTTQAIVCNTPDGQRTPCDEKPVTLGLVGLHLVQQTSNGGAMFWSTPSGNATGCFTCHYKATSNIKNAKGEKQDSNHSFFFLEAQFATMKPRG
jgi:hypothetical protein